jgi:GH24 family phage-related lysozyme (muramidase)
MRTISAEGRARLTEPWEECVLHVYDDKVGKQHIDGRLQYPEWDGGPVRGTLTIGFGHTNAAGGLRITQGLRITREQADALLSADLAPCERRVAAALRVAVTQHQFDALVDLDFNCPSALGHVAAVVNAGDWPAAERIALQYVNSKGERMPGLVHRRCAEIAWANTPDNPVVAQSTVIAPKAERAAPPGGMATSRSGTAAITIGAIGASGALQQVNDAASSLKTAKQNLVELGLGDELVAAMHLPAFWIALAAVALAAFVWFDRRARLRGDHV